MKNFAYLILILILVFVFCIFVFKKDYGYDLSKEPLQESLNIIDSYIPKPKNITIDGVDYLQSQLPLGKFGGVYTSGILGDPKSFNPYNANDATSSELSEIMYDGLLQTNPSDGEVIPKLAKDYKILKDNKTYIINLRKGIKWTDGKEITADDVIFTYNTVIFQGFGDGGTKDIMTIDGKLPTVEKINKYCVKFTTPKPFAPFLRALSASIVPEHIFKIATDKGKEYFLTFQSIDVKPENIVSSGAFKLKEYIPSQRIVFEKNPNYYLINKNNKKLPYIDKWVNIISGDTNNQTLKFESGALDTLAINGALLERYKELKRHGDFDLYNLGASTTTTFIAFNLNNRKNKEGKYYVNPIKQSWFQDRNFRTALDYALDRDDVIINIFSGLASPLFTAEPINGLYVNEKIAKGHKKDLKYAQNLLQKSGFYKKDGILYDKKGNKVEFELLTNAGNTQREATGVSIKQDFEQLGIKINFKAVEFNSLVNKIINEANFDCIIMGLTSNINEPNAGYNVWNPYGTLHLFNKRTQNDLASSDKILDFENEISEIFKKGALELNFQKRKEYYNKYQEIIAYENPMIYLYSPLNIYAVRKKIKNIYPTKLGGLFSSLSEIYIDD